MWKYEVTDRGLQNLRHVLKLITHIINTVFIYYKLVESWTYQIQEKCDKHIFQIMCTNFIAYYIWFCTTLSTRGLNILVSLRNLCMITSVTSLLVHVVVRIPEFDLSKSTLTYEWRQREEWQDVTSEWLKDGGF